MAAPGAPQCSGALRAAHDALLVPPTLEDLRAEPRPTRSWFQSTLRQRCRSALDVPIRPTIPSRNKPGSQIVMTNTELEVAYTRRREHMVGRKKALEWAIDEIEDGGPLLPGGDGGLSPASRTPMVGVAFWHSMDEQSPCLPDSFAFGLKTAIVNARLRVQLLHYHPLENVPPGVELVNAGSVLDYEVARGVIERRGVQFLADFIRAKQLMQGGGALSCGGWFLDGDAVWLRKAPSLTITDPSNLGHFFASLSADKKLRGKTKDDFDKFWNLEYLAKPGDRLYLASPFAFPPGSPVLAEWVQQMEAAFGEQALSRLDYHISFHFILRSLRKWGLESSIVEQDTCSPVSRFLNREVLMASQRHKFDLDAIRLALCVNNFWQSSKNLEAAQSAVDAGCHSRVEKNSAWDSIMELATMPKFKRVGKRSWSSISGLSSSAAASASSAACSPPVAPSATPATSRPPAACSPSADAFVDNHPHSLASGMGL